MERRTRAAGKGDPRRKRFSAMKKPRPEVYPSSGGRKGKRGLLAIAKSHKVWVEEESASEKTTRLRTCLFVLKKKGKQNVFEEPCAGEGSSRRGGGGEALTVAKRKNTSFLEGGILSP